MAPAPPSLGGLGLRRAAGGRAAGGRAGGPGARRAAARSHGAGGPASVEQARGRRRGGSRAPPLAADWPRRLGSRSSPNPRPPEVRCRARPPGRPGCRPRGRALRSCAGPRPARAPSGPPGLAPGTRARDVRAPGRRAPQPRARGPGPPFGPRPFLCGAQRCGGRSRPQSPAEFPRGGLGRPGPRLRTEPRRARPGPGRLPRPGARAGEEARGTAGRPQRRSAHRPLRRGKLKPAGDLSVRGSGTSGWRSGLGDPWKLSS